MTNTGGGGGGGGGKMMAWRRGIWGHTQVFSPAVL